MVTDVWQWHPPLVIIIIPRVNVSSIHSLTYVTACVLWTLLWACASTIPIDAMWRGEKINQDVAIQSNHLLTLITHAEGLVVVLLQAESSMSQIPTSVQLITENGWEWQWLSPEPITTKQPGNIHGEWKTSRDVGRHGGTRTEVRRR